MSTKTNYILGGIMSRIAKVFISLTFIFTIIIIIGLIFVFTTDSNICTNKNTYSTLVIITLFSNLISYLLKYRYDDLRYTIPLDINKFIQTVDKTMDIGYTPYFKPSHYELRNAKYVEVNDDKNTILFDEVGLPIVGPETSLNTFNMDIYLKRFSNRSIFTPEYNSLIQATKIILLGDRTMIVKSGTDRYVLIHRNKYGEFIRDQERYNYKFKYNINKISDVINKYTNELNTIESGLNLVMDTQINIDNLYLSRENIIGYKYVNELTKISHNLSNNNLSNKFKIPILGYINKIQNTINDVFIENIFSIPKNINLLIEKLADTKNNKYIIFNFHKEILSSFLNQERGYSSYYNFFSKCKSITTKINYINENIISRLSKIEFLPNINVDNNIININNKNIKYIDINTKITEYLRDSVLDLNQLSKNNITTSTNTNTQPINIPIKTSKIDINEMAKKGNDYLTIIDKQINDSIKSRDIIKRSNNLLPNEKKKNILGLESKITQLNNEKGDIIKQLNESLKNIKTINNNNVVPLNKISNNNYIPAINNSTETHKKYNNFIKNIVLERKHNKLESKYGYKWHNFVKNKNLIKHKLEELTKKEEINSIIKENTLLKELLKNVELTKDKVVEEQINQDIKDIIQLNQNTTSLLKKLDNITESNNTNDNATEIVQVLDNINTNNKLIEQSKYELIKNTEGIVPISNETKIIMDKVIREIEGNSTNTKFTKNIDTLLNIANENNNKSTNDINLENINLDMIDNNSESNPQMIQGPNIYSIPESNNTFPSNNEYIPESNPQMIQGPNMYPIPESNNEYIPESNNTFLSNNEYIPESNNTFLSNNEYIPESNNTFLSNNEYIPKSNRVILTPLPPRESSNNRFLEETGDDIHLYNPPPPTPIFS
jgi:hypothetical protein